MYVGIICTFAFTNQQAINLDQDTIKTHLLNGKRLYFSFLAGAQRIFENQKGINKINVFPVQDGDTGTNLASTMRAIIDTYIPTSNIKVTADALAEAALVGARGNSGIIFAQFVYGFSDYIAQEDTHISMQKFAEALKNAVKCSYESIQNPVEGTMITVMREWAEAIDKLKESQEIKDFKDLIIKSLQSAKQSLENTPKKLEVLAKSKVVDAGGKAFVHFLEGMTDFFVHGEIRAILRNRNVARVEDLGAEFSHEEVTYRYCTECLIDLDTSQAPLSKESLIQELSFMGDSLVVAPTRTKLRIHIHTDTPSAVFAKLENKGRLVYQKVDDMVMQKDIVNNRKADIALITDSAADLPQELVDKYQIQVVPYRVQFGEQSFLDGLTLSSEDFYTKLQSTKEIPQSAQPSYHDFLNRYNYLSSHYPAVIGLHMSKGMSGLWSNSFRAGNAVAKQQDKDISVISSKRLTSGEGLLVLRTAEAIHQGMDKETIVKNINEWTDKTHIFVSTRTLKYMVRSGRVSPVKAAFGKILNLKPVVSMNNEGRAEVVAKPFTSNGSVNAVLKLAKQVLAKVDNKIWGYAISHADNEKVALQYAEEMERLTGMKPKFISPAAPVLALHVGRGVVALSILEK